MFIGQEAGAINPEIFRQLRVRVFGYGLLQGSERRAVEEVVSSDAFKLYEGFVDPQAANPPKYQFMISGPVSPLTFSGNPVFIETYTDFQQYLNANDLGTTDVAPW
jgi:hypothetical protein